MKKEFEIYRSNFYSIVFLIASLISFIIGLIFIVAKIEWSVFLGIMSFLLFAGFLGMFAWLFLRPFVVATVNNNKITIYDGKTIEFEMDKIEKVQIKSNLMTLELNIFAEGKEEKFEWYVSKSYEVKVILQDILEKTGKEVITEENYIK